MEHWSREMLLESLGGAAVLICFAVIGTLKGYDQLMNLVLDEVKEALTGTMLMACVQ